VIDIERVYPFNSQKREDHGDIQEEDGEPLIGSARCAQEVKLMDF
jgi:hypothetical protein